MRSTEQEVQADSCSPRSLNLIVTIPTGSEEQNLLPIYRLKKPSALSTRVSETKYYAAVNNYILYQRYSPNSYKQTREGYVTNVKGERKLDTDKKSENSPKQRGTCLAYPCTQVRIEKAAFGIHVHS